MGFFVRSLGEVSNEVSAATAVLTLTSVALVGDTVIVTGACDNNGAAGIASVTSVTDSKSNTWTFTTRNNTAGVAADGVTAFIAYSKLTVQLSALDTITVNFSPNTVSKAFQASLFTGIAAVTGQTVNAAGTSTTPSAATSATIVPGSLVLGLVAVEGPSSDTFTEDADTTNGPWNSLVRTSSGNNTTSSVTSNVAWKIATAAGIQTYDPILGTSRDWAELAFVFCPSPNQSVRITATANTRVDTPDAAAFDVAGDHDVRAWYAADQWTVTQKDVVVRRNNGGGAAFIELRVAASTPVLSWRVGGVTSGDRTATVALSLVAGQAVWLGATLDVNNGAAGHDVKFYTFDGSVSNPPADITTWIQLGATVTTVGVTSVDTGTGDYILGERDGASTQQAVGNIFKAQVRNGINGSIILDPDFTSSGDGWFVGNVTTTGKSDGLNTWTLRGSSIIQNGPVDAFTGGFTTGSVDNEIAGHEIAGENVNTSAVFSPPSEGVGILCGGGYGAFKYAGATYGGGAKCSTGCAEDTDEEYAGHEYAGMCVNVDAEFITDLETQTYGCGNGYAGGQFAALLYGGGVPCNGQSPTPPTPGGIKSNVEEFCILDSSCA